MNNKKPNVLILGANGMLGSAVNNYLSYNKSINTIGTNRKHLRPNQINLDVTDSFANLDQVVKENKINFIINCIGVLKSNNKSDYTINYTLPKYLDKNAVNLNYKLLHISTDDVFPYSAKKVNEKSKPSPSSDYGKSKLKGETKSINSLTIRTSILGVSKSMNNFLDLVIKEKNKKIYGFQNQTWSGCTTTQLSKFIEYLISIDFKTIRYKSRIVHFVPLGPYSKYEVLKSFSNEFNKTKIIIKKDSQISITRQLDSIILSKNYLATFGTNIDAELKKLNKAHCNEK